MNGVQCGPSRREPGIFAGRAVLLGKAGGLGLSYVVSRRAARRVAAVVITHFACTARRTGGPGPQRTSVRYSGQLI